MNTISTIFMKELKDTLRDRRTIITMIIIPVLLIPVLLGIVSNLATKQITKAQTEILNIGLIDHGNAPQFRTLLLKRSDLSIVDGITEENLKGVINDEKIKGAYVFNKDFDKQVMGLKSGSVTLYYKSTEEHEITRNRLAGCLEEFEKILLSSRFAKLNLDETIVHPFTVEEVNIASTRERLGQIVGGFLPYIFIIFCFMGCMYPAIDLGAGEKERGTLETLMTSPANRMQILIGKFGVIALAGILTAGFSILGLYVGMQKFGESAEEIFTVIESTLEVKSIVLVLSLMLPVTILFAALELSISIFAKSFKEAQSLITPLNIVIILPAMLGLLPSVKLDTATAAIPIINVTLATKNIISGTMTTGLLVEVYVSSVILAGLSLYACTWWFKRENVLFRS